MTENYAVLRKMVDELNSTNSSNSKKDILIKYKNDEFIRNVLYYTYNPMFQYYVTPDTLEKNYTEDLGVLYCFNDLFEMLDILRKREVTGHKAINSVNDYCYKNEEYKDLIYKIIGKDLEIRMGDSLINKVIPGLVPTFDVSLASKFEDVPVDFLKEKWYASRKLDGVRCCTIVDENGNVSHWSRQGNEFETLGVITEEIKKLNLKNIVFDGEICVVDENGNEDFQRVMKEIRRKNHTIVNPKYFIFDVIDRDDFMKKSGKTKFSDRYETLKSLIPLNKHLTVVLQTLISSEDAFLFRMKDADLKGWEGLIIRKDVGYEGKRSKNMLKCKSFADAEYEVIEVEFGPFRMIENGLEVTKEVLSNVVINHKGFKVSVGSGFSIEERQYYKQHPEEIIGKTITVKYFQETKNQTGGISLRFPTVKCIYKEGRNV